MRLVLSLGQVQYTTRSRSFGSNEGFARTFLRRQPPRTGDYYGIAEQVVWLANINN